jgi:hypothetical protein
VCADEPEVIRRMCEAVLEEAREVARRITGRVEGAAGLDGGVGRQARPRAGRAEAGG